MRLRRPVPYEELDHTADAGICVRGADERETLARLVLAYADLVAGGASVEESAEIEIAVEPGDAAAMAVDVLRELLFLFDTEHCIPSSCEVWELDEAEGARVAVGVGPYDPALHADGTVLKAVTLHAARFERDGAGWRAEVVFDV